MTRRVKLQLLLYNEMDMTWVQSDKTNWSLFLHNSSLELLVNSKNLWSVEHKMLRISFKKSSRTKSSRERDVINCMTITVMWTFKERTPTKKAIDSKRVLETVQLFHYQNEGRTWDRHAPHDLKWAWRKWLSISTTTLLLFLLSR